MSGRDVRSRGSFAAGVSRALIAAGLRPLPSGTSRTREGVRVSAALPGTALVAVDIDAPTKAERTARDIAGVLSEAGYTIAVNPHDSLLMTVSREA